MTQQLSDSSDCSSVTPSERHEHHHQQQHNGGETAETLESGFRKVSQETNTISVDLGNPLDSLVSTSLLKKMKQTRRESFDSFVDGSMISIEEETSMEIMTDDRLRLSKKASAQRNKAKTNDTICESPTPSPEDDNDERMNENGDVDSVKIPPHDLTWKEKFTKARQYCGWAVNMPRVQWIMILFITINAIMMGIATFDFVKEDPSMAQAFEITDLVFLSIFTVELAMQFFYLGIRLLQDGWLVFDLIVIGASWLSVGYNEGAADLQILRAFRIFRTFRLITRVKVMKLLVKALWSVMPRMGAIFLMLMLVFYIFAVMFTQLYAPLDHALFGNLQNSLLTLFQMMTMDGWSDITRDIMEDERYAWVFAISFVIITGFVMVNLMVAVVCDAIGDLDKKDKANILHGYDSGTDSEGLERIELRQQLDLIEDQVGDLTRIQARTFHTLEYLTQQLQDQKAKRQKEKKKNPQDNKRESSTKRGSMDTGTSSKKPLPQFDGSKKNKKGANNNLSPNHQQKKRITYTDTWTQQGSEKQLRRATISNFAKMAKELKAMKEMNLSDSE